MSNAETDFTLRAYQVMIEALMARNYAVRGYAGAEASNRHLILRHDVDFDLDAAIGMAETEAKQGWRATYFVLLRTEFYNPLSQAGTAAVRQLINLGHDVGLHFDASLYAGDEAGLISAVKSESATLEQISDAPVTCFSLHRPHPDMLDNGFEVDGLINAYAPRYFRDFGYCSDSRGAWHHGHPLDHAAVKQGSALQLLTHPIWWIESGDIPSDKCSAFLERRQAILDQEMQRNCQAYEGRRSE